MVIFGFVYTKIRILSMIDVLRLFNLNNCSANSRKKDGRNVTYDVYIFYTVNCQLNIIIKKWSLLLFKSRNLYSGMLLNYLLSGSLENY